MATKLEVLRDISASLGFPRQIEQIPAEYDCPIHDIPIVEHHVETISGWQAVMVCPAFDGTCRYDPDGEAMQIEAPEGKKSTGERSDDEGAPAPRPAAKPANQGGF